MNKQQQQQTVKDLRLWATFLRTRVPESNFDMDYWKDGDAALDPDKMDGSCGTVACAAGWATAIPEFAARGLGYDEDECELFFQRTEGEDRIWGVGAVGDFFGIVPSDANHITDPEAYTIKRPNILAVSERIEKLADKLEISACIKR